jgi:quinol monooxygenase YgiN
MPHVATLVSGRTRPGRRDDLCALFVEHLGARAIDNPAQRLVLWLADEADADAFHLVEVYADATVMEANARTEWFAAYMAAAMPLLDGMPSMRMATPRWAKGVDVEEQ